MTGRPDGGWASPAQPDPADAPAAPEFDTGGDGTFAAPANGEPDAPLHPDPEQVQDDDEGDAPPAAEIISQLRRLLGVSVGDVWMSGGQNATGPGATSIGRLNLFGSSVEDGIWQERLAQGQIQERLMTYVPTPSDSELEQAVKGQPMVWLLGRPETGRRTSAIIALAQRYGPGRVVALSADRADRLLRRDITLERGCGYLLDLGGERTELAEQVILGLGSRASRLNSTFLIVGPPRLGAMALAGEVIHQPPAGGDVLRAHFLRANPRVCRHAAKACGGGGCLERYLDQELLRHPDLLAHLRAAPPLAEIVGLARQIASDPPRGAALSTLLSEHLPDQLRHRACAILDGVVADHDPDYLRSVRLSCAVLDGFPRRDIEQAAQRLLGPSSATAADVPLRRPPLERLFGDGVVVETGQGRAAGPTVRFAPAHGSLRAAMLSVAWTEWNASDRLLAWLVGLIEEVPATRYAAAQVIGWSASQDRRAAFEAVLQLASNKRNSVRQAAAVAVVAMAIQPPLGPWLHREVGAWARAGTAFLCDVVARAYLLGLRDVWPDSALAHLELVVQHRLQAPYQVVSRVVEDHYRAGYASQVVSTVLRWSDDDRAELRLHAARVARRLVALPAAPPRDRWPDLLDRVDAAELDPLQVGALWSVALSTPSTAFRSWRSLGDWVQRCVEDAAAGRAVLDLIHILCAQPPLRRRLAHHVRNLWPEEMADNVLLPQISRLVLEA